MKLVSAFAAPLRFVTDREAAAGGEHARQAGRSWWAAQFTDGRVIHEWDADPLSPNGHMDWPRLVMLGALNGICALRLYAPNGRMVELGGDTDQTGKLFQVKSSVRHVRAESTRGLLGLTLLGQETMAHVIGILKGYNGDCTLFAWEPLPQPEPPAGCPPLPKKPDYNNPEQPLWALKEQHANYMAARDKYDAYIFGPELRAWKQRVQEWEANARGRLVGPITDNVYAMRYQNIGRLNADHLGIVEGEGR